MIRFSQVITLTSFFLFLASFAESTSPIDVFKKDPAVQQRIKDVIEKIRRVNGAGVHIEVSEATAIALGGSSGIVGSYTNYLITTAITPRTVNAQTEIVAAKVKELNAHNPEVLLIAQSALRQIVKIAHTPAPVFSAEFAAASSIEAFQKTKSIQKSKQQIIAEIRQQYGAETKIEISEPTDILLHSGSGVAGITSNSLVSVTIAPLVVNAQPRVVMAFTSRIGNSATSAMASLLSDTQFREILQTVNGSAYVSADYETKVGN